MTNVITLHNVRLKYPRLFHAEANKLNPNSKVVYSARVVIAKDNPDYAKLVAEIKAAAVEKFGSRAEKVMAEAKDSKTTRGLHVSDIDGHMEFNVKRGEQHGAPTVYGRNAKPLAESAGVPRAGDWVNLKVKPWWYDNQSRGLAFELGPVQFVSEGEPFSGAAISNTADDFEVLESSDKKGDAFFDDDDVF